MCGCCDITENVPELKYIVKSEGLEFCKKAAVTWDFIKKSITEIQFR